MSTSYTWRRLDRTGSIEGVATLTYVQPCSLDLRIADDRGDFSWAEPPEAVHVFANALEERVGTHVYGRRMWETMRFWATMPDEDSVMGAFGRAWRDADTLVVSGSLRALDVPRAELVPRLDPDDLRRRKEGAEADLVIGGAALAAAAMRAGLVDEIGLLVAPVVVGSGPRALPDGLRIRTEPIEQRALGGGWTWLRHAVRSGW